MSSTVISVENLSKQYRLGQVGTGTLSADLTRLWCRLRGKEDPFLQVGQVNDREKKADKSSEPKGGLLSRLSPLASSQDLVWALKDVNFEVKEGEVLGIIGRNGAGKSTLLKVLARVTTPTTGSVKIRGRIASLLEVGTGFHPDLSGRENIYLNGAILGMRKQEITRQLDEIVGFSGCDRYIDTPVKRYSSGMYVRLAFAVAAHLDPEILIIDEVLAVGDAEFQKKCLGKMRDVAQGGRTVLFVSHNMVAMRTLCTHGLYMRNGRVECDGLIDTIINDYLSDSSNVNVGEIHYPQLQENHRGAVIRRVNLTVDSQTVSEIPLSKQLTIEMDYEVLREDAKISASFHVNDSLGTCVFATANVGPATLLGDTLGGKPHQVGRYRTTCIIPQNFLNDANYTLSAFLVWDASNIVDEKRDCLRFSGLDDGSMREEFIGKWIGVVRPRFQWNTETIGKTK